MVAFAFFRLFLPSPRSYQQKNGNAKKFTSISTIRLRRVPTPVELVRNQPFLMPNWPEKISKFFRFSFGGKKFPKLVKKIMFPRNVTTCKATEYLGRFESLVNYQSAIK